MLGCTTVQAEGAMFRAVSSQVRFTELESDILQFWEQHRIFQKSTELRKGAQPFVFYEGPPTANGLPGIHHVLARAFKDLFPRYKTMKGFYCSRKGGWDTHGLPVELEVEQQLGLSSKQEIEDYGIAQFNQKCRESVFRYLKEWRRLTERIGFWIDMDDPYITLTNSYIESVWWIIKQLWDKDLVYQGYKVVPYCPRCGTPLSSHEVAQGYRTTKDPSIYVKFPLRDQKGTYFLVWTTTPWTLPGNVALAVHPDVEYVMVRKKGVSCQGEHSQDEEKLILARELMERALEGDYEVLRTLRARDLAGQHYLPLYTFLPVEKDHCRVVEADFVTTEEGTGVVHIAPAFGADDLEVGKEEDLPVLQTVDLRGRFIDEVTPWRGLFVKDADPDIMENLEARGLLYRATETEHVYPFCWRSTCGSPLLYYAKTSWFIETTKLKDRLIANNAKINWYPEHIKEGRFGNWLENNVDWAFGRERYWGTPLPVWECDRCHRRECIGSVKDLEDRSRIDLSDLDLHRPAIDEVTFHCDECGGEMRRVPDVVDCWLDSGAMPVAQWHYPLENQETFQEQFPADFISEAVDQTRGWFYSLHAVSTLLFDEPCYRNVVCLGLVLDEKGEKMSKSKGNVVDPWEVLDAHGADALRWYLYSASPPGNERRFSTELVGEVVRKFLLTLWNTYAFFVTYANIDGFDPQAAQVPVQRRTTMDRWVLSELNHLVADVDEAMEGYNVTGATRLIEEFVHHLSNWYVRRNRRRFWKGEQDEDKAAAHLTLHDCLLTLSKLLAPFTPFVAEEMYRNLALSADATAPESVHLADYPSADPALIDRKLTESMKLAIRASSLGRAARNKAQIKIRQPIEAAIVKVRSEAEKEMLEGLSSYVRDELNAKRLEIVEDENDLVEYSVRPVPRLVGPKHGDRLSAIRGALGAMDAKAVADLVRRGEEISVEVEGETVRLLPEEVQVDASDREGLASMEENGFLVAIKTHLSEELQREGLAREVVRRIQTMRKSADFRIEDTITTYYLGEEDVMSVIEEFKDYIARETLSRNMIASAAPDGIYSEETKVDGQKLLIGIARTG